MRYLITFVFLFISYFSFGQVVGTQVLAFQGNVTSTIRDGLDVPTGQYWMIYNTTTLQIEVAGDDDVWTALSASGGTDDQTAAEVPFTPYSTIASTNVQAAIQEALDEATGTDDQTAAEVPITDAGALITATDVEGALQENRTAIDLNTAKEGLTTGSVAADELASTTVTPGSYTNTDLTVDADGRITAASNGSAGGGLASTDIDTYSELNTIVADVTLTHNGLFDTFAELDAIVADKSLAKLEDAQTFTGAKTYTANHFIRNDIFTNITSADVWVVSPTNAENPDLTFHMYDGGVGGGGSITETYNLVFGAPSDVNDIIDLGFLQAGLDDLASVIDASAFSGNLATTDDTIQELADAVDGLALGGGGLANVVEDTTPELGGNLDAMNFAVSNLLEVEWVYTTGANVVYTGFSAGNDSFRLAAPNDASQSLRYTFSTGLWFYPYDNADSGLAANNLQSAVDEIIDEAMLLAGTQTVTGNKTFSGEVNLPDDVIIATDATDSWASIQFDIGSVFRELKAEGGQISYNNDVLALDANKPDNTIAGRTGTTVSGMIIQTEAQIATDGAAAADELVFCSDCAPMIDAGSTTITAHGYTGFDDRIPDNATYTFSGLTEGSVVVIEMDRATVPALSGITPSNSGWASDFVANARQTFTLLVLPSGDGFIQIKTVE